MPIPTGLLLLSLFAIAAVFTTRSPSPAVEAGSLGPQPSAMSAPLTAVGPTKIPAEQQSSSELDPGTPPEELPGGCDPHYGVVSWFFPLSVEAAAARSQAVVRATVDAAGTGQWNTPGGKAPDPRLASGLDVMHLVRLTEVTPVSGTTPSTLVVWVPGGTIGCVTFTIPDWDLRVGQEYLVFLASSEPAFGSKGTLRASEAWPIVDGLVQTPAEGRMSVANITAALATAR